MRVIAVVLAGGVGSRIGSKTPKQFMAIKGKPMVCYALEKYQNSKSINEIVVVCVESYIRKAEKFFVKYNLTKVSKIVPGGSEFIFSLSNGINSIDNLRDEDIIVVASGDRPIVSLEEIDDSVAVCKKYGSGIAARRCDRCMFLVNDKETCSNVYLRDRLVQIGTPWSFKYGLLRRALSNYFSGSIKSEPYPPAIFVANGNPVFFSTLLPNNIKVTYKYDLKLLRLILKEEHDK